MIESEMEADGDEGLGRVAKPLRGRKKKDKTLWIHCVDRQGIKGDDKEQGDGNGSWGRGHGCW